LVHFLAIIAWLQHESALFYVLSRTGTQDNNFLFLFPNFRIQLDELNKIE